MKKEELTASPHITSIDIDLFDFIKNRVKIGLCVSENLFFIKSNKSISIDVI